MCSLYETIKELCEAKGVSPSRMCVELKISKSTMTDLKSGRRPTVTLGTAQKIADYFGVSVDRVLGISEQKEKPTLETKSELNPVQQELFEIIKGGDADTVKALLDFAHLIKKNRGAE